jgi:hypothetical protein
MERLTHDYVRIIVELTEMRIANQFGELRPIIAKQFRSPSFSTLLATLSAVGDSCGQHAFRIAHRTPRGVRLRKTDKRGLNGVFDGLCGATGNRPAE